MRKWQWLLLFATPIFIVFAAYQYIQRTSLRVIRAEGNNTQHNSVPPTTIIPAQYHNSSTPTTIIPTQYHNSSTSTTVQSMPIATTVAHRFVFLHKTNYATDRLVQSAQEAKKHVLALGSWYVFVFWPRQNQKDVEKDFAMLQEKLGADHVVLYTDKMHEDLYPEAWKMGRSYGSGTKPRWYLCDAPEVLWYVKNKDRLSQPDAPSFVWAWDWDVEWMGSLGHILTNEFDRVSHLVMYGGCCGKSAHIAARNKHTTTYNYPNHTHRDFNNYLEADEMHSCIVMVGRYSTRLLGVIEDNYRHGNVSWCELQAPSLCYMHEWCTIYPWNSSHPTMSHLANGKRGFDPLKRIGREEWGVLQRRWFEFDKPQGKLYHGVRW